MSSGAGAERPFRSLFCGFLWPRHPGRSGGEIRDFHIVRHLLGRSEVEYFALQAEGAPEDDRLLSRLRALHLPETVPVPSLVERAVLLLQRWGVPLAGGALHSDAEHKLAAVRGLAPPLQAALDRGDADFLFVSPQVNPVARLLDARRSRARFVLATYDVEAVRVRRLAEAESGPKRRGLLLEAGRAERFEQDHLSRFDGVIAVSELDRGIFVDRYGLPPHGVLVLENGVDPEYFGFRERAPGPPEVVFVGALGYPPNAQAARRLATSILPLARRAVPDCRLLVVGQSPDEALRALDDGRGTIVTGAVPDVRPYLARASAACVPLLSGSGTKYKVLESLSAGVPVACSPLAVEGLEVEDGRHLLVGDSDEALAAALVRLLREPALGRRLAAEGRRRVVERYAWEANLPRLDPWLDELARRPPRRRA